MTTELTEPETAPDIDRLIRRLAYPTVGVPAAGFVGAVLFSLRYGFSWADGLTLGGMYLLTALGVEAGLHRLLSHCAFRAEGAVAAALLVAGSMAAQGQPIFWVGIHRVHHAFADTDRDPHSPRPIGTGPLARLRGLWHGHVGWLFTLRRSNWEKHISDLLASRTVMRMNRLYLVWVTLGLAVPTVVAGLLTGSLTGALGGLLWGGLARIFLLDNVVWGVNSICHTIGSRLYPTRDDSRNFGLMAPLSVGGSWHNNHHARPSLAFNRHSFWQIDISGILIRLLDRLGLIHDVRYKNRDRSKAGR